MLCAFLLALASVARASEHAPIVAASQAGSVIEDVTVDTHGSTRPPVVMQYLTMRTGQVLSQDGIDHDYATLTLVAGYEATLSVRDGNKPGTVSLHWDVVAKVLAPTYHPYYADKPLTAPFQGIGFVVTSPALDRRGTTFSAFSQLAQRANLFSGLITRPIRVDPLTSKESDIVVSFSGGKGVYRQLVPPNKNVYSWTDQIGIDYWSHNANDTQFEAGFRYNTSSTQIPSGLSSPFLYPTWRAPSHNLVAEAGLLHGCVDNAARWYPPYCSFQYRLFVADEIGGFGSTSKYEGFNGGAAWYFRAGNSAIALQGKISRSGGVLPDSFLVCSGARAYPKPFCGTDTQLLQAEYRLNDALPEKVKFIFFFDDAASRVRGETFPENTSTFEWHDSYGIGISYRNFIRIDLGYGKPGGRLTFALEGQTF